MAPPQSDCGRSRSELPRSGVKFSCFSRAEAGAELELDWSGFPKSNYGCRRRDLPKAGIYISFFTRAADNKEHWLHIVAALVLRCFVHISLECQHKPTKHCILSLKGYDDLLNYIRIIIICLFHLFRYFLKLFAVLAVMENSVNIDTIFIIKNVLF